MVSPQTPIRKSDLDALATLATAKLSPATDYSFNAFAGKDKIALPADITCTPDYATVSPNPFQDGSKVTLRLYGYKTIAGVKTYTWIPLRKAFIGATGAGSYSMTWSWLAPAANAPDGYIVGIPLALGLGWQIAWQDIGNVLTFSEDGGFDNPAWKFDNTLDADNLGVPDQNLPCGRGTWLKMLNTIWRDLFAGLDVFGGSDWLLSDDLLVSGPWCVSVAPKCYLTLNNFNIFKNLQFIYSEADSVDGNQLASEADMRTTYIGVANGANTFDWGVNVLVNGRIIIFSTEGQALADWTVATSHPGITFSFDAHYIDEGFPGGRTVTAFIFDFVDVQYLLGVSIVLTVTPNAGGSVINPGDPAGAGGWVNAIFTGDLVTYTAANTIAIHPGSDTIAPAAAKVVDLASSLIPITFSTGIGGTNVQESHHRAFCNGVFKANTLPTMGVMSYLDVDLPQYREPAPLDGSTRRTARNVALPYQPVVDNRGALWPVIRDTDYTAPTGTFFPTRKDDSGNDVPQKEGYSYTFPGVDSFSPQRPIPLYGYCVWSFTIRRQPVANASGIKISPSTGTGALDVKIGLMNTVGAFVEMQTITIPAGQASVTVEVFWTVLAGATLVYQCAEIVAIMAAVNFQPMMHASFLDSTVKVGGNDYTVGYYSGPLWFDNVRTLLFFIEADFKRPIVLPITASVYNDLTAILDLL